MNLQLKKKLKNESPARPLVAGESAVAAAAGKFAVTAAV